MKNYLVAIVGLPNSGKSTIFNALIKKNKSVVSEIKGTTRDRIYGTCEWKKKHFDLIDTGGIQTKKASSNKFDKDIQLQVQIAISEADLIYYVVDGRLEPSQIDLVNIKKILKSKKPVFLIVNKVENKELINYAFSNTPVKDIFFVSALHSTNFYLFLEETEKYLSRSEVTTDTNFKYRMAIVGLTNAGKSSLANYLLKDSRSIVSEDLNTTRDSVNSVFIYKESKYEIIDTPGFRKTSKILENLLFYSYLRTYRDIENCNFVMFVIDVSQPISKAVKQIAKLLYEKRKAGVLILNKVDLLNKAELIKFKQDLRNEIKELNYYKQFFVSIINEVNINKIMQFVDEYDQYLSVKVKTSDLNNFLIKLQLLKAPPVHKNKELKMYYINQSPKSFYPLFYIYVNDKKLYERNYSKFLYNKLTLIFKIKYVPVDIKVKLK